MKGQWGIDDFHVAINSSGPSNYNLSSSRNISIPIPDPRPEAALEDAITARKVQKADREKLRRDRLNEYFVELGRTTDPDRPKNDKLTVLSETIQLLKDLTAEVDQLKAECATLAEESNELEQEKNELQEEKQSLQCVVNSLNSQCENHQRVSFRWGCVEQQPPPVVMTPAFSYPFPLSVPPTPYPFFGNQGVGLLPNPYTTFIPFCPPDAPPPSGPHTTRRESGGMGTDLELKTPGSSDRLRVLREEAAEASAGEGSRKGRGTESCSSGSGMSSQALEDSCCSTTLSE